MRLRIWGATQKKVVRGRFDVFCVHILWYWTYELEKFREETLICFLPPDFLVWLSDFSSNLKKWKTILAPISQVIFITQVTLLKQSFEVDIILGDWGWTGQGNADWTERYERFWGSVGCYPIHFSQPRSRIIRPNWRFLSRYRKKAQTELEIDEQYDLLPGYRRVLPETP